MANINCNGKNDVGGIVGINTYQNGSGNVNVYNCINYGDITNGDECIGGVIGRISDSRNVAYNLINFGNVSGNKYTGGVVGRNQNVSCLGIMG